MKSAFIAAALVPNLPCQVIIKDLTASVQDDDTTIELSVPNYFRYQASYSLDVNQYEEDRP
jgi:hypothetical protein